MPPIACRSTGSQSAPTESSAGSVDWGKDHSEAVEEDDRRNLAGVIEAAERLFGTARTACVGAVTISVRELGVPSAMKASSKAMSEAQPGGSAVRYQPGKLR